MSDDLTMKIGAVAIDPENPVRLRECLDALAAHLGTHVMRLEISLGDGTRGVKEPAISMVLTHSMGVEHELALMPDVAVIFAKAMAAMIAPRSTSDQPK